MKVTKRIHKGKRCIIIDGRRHTLKQAAEALGIPESKLHYGYIKNNGDAFQQWMDDAVWKLEHNVSLKQKITCVDGKKMCTELLCRIAGIAISTSCRRVDLWAAGKKTYEEMTEDPTEAKRKAGVAAAERINRARKARMPKVPGMQPRRSISDLPRPGTWERDLPEPKDGMGYDSNCQRKGALAWTV